MNFDIFIEPEMTPRVMDLFMEFDSIGARKLKLALIVLVSILF